MAPLRHTPRTRAFDTRAASGITAHSFRAPESPMVDAPRPGQPQLTGNVPFFKRAEPLNVQQHGKLGLKRVEKPYAFAAEAHLAPVTLGEFGAAALTYPIVFLGAEKVAFAVMGLRQGTNLFMRPNGDFEDDVYIPGFIRRYPFVLAAEPQGDRFIVCVDAASDLVGENAETPFFENGQPTQFTKDAIEFLQNFEAHRRATVEFSKRLAELDLFEEKTVNFQGRKQDGGLEEPVKIADYHAVSLDRLNALPAETFAKLRDEGAAAAIYCHTISLMNWQRVLNKALRRASSAPQA